MPFLPLISPREYRGVTGYPLQRSKAGVPWANLNIAMRVFGWIMLAAGAFFIGAIVYNTFVWGFDENPGQPGAMALFLAFSIVVILFGLYLVRWRYTYEDGYLVQRGIIRGTRYSVKELALWAEREPIVISLHGVFKIKKQRGYLRIRFQYANGTVQLLEHAFARYEEEHLRTNTDAQPEQTQAEPAGMARENEESSIEPQPPHIATDAIDVLLDTDHQPSIYESILLALEPDGTLPGNFSLPDEGEGPVRWAFGAQDGVALYHTTAFYSEDEAAANKLMRALNDGAEEADIFPLLRSNGMVEVAGSIAYRVRHGLTGAALGPLFFHARQWVANGRDTELVKLGIVVLGAMNIEYDEECRELLITLGRCDEFTYYVLMAAQEWYDYQDVVFDLAQHLDGWGKIHAVGRMAADTGEKTEWLITEGCANTVSNSYLALPCAEKTSLRTYLRRHDMTQEQFDGCGVIISGLLETRPMNGIATYARHADVREMFSLYLKHAETLCDDLINLCVVLDIRDWCVQQQEIDQADASRTGPEQITDYTPVISLCNDFLSRPKWAAETARVLEAAAHGEDGDQQLFAALRVAEACGHPYHEALYDVVAHDPMQNAGYIRHLFRNKDIRSKVVALYENTLTSQSICEASSAGMSAGFGFDVPGVLNFVLQELNAWPLTGEPLVKLGIQSPIVSNRIVAAKALEAWRDALRRPVQRFSPALAKAVEDAAMAETDLDTMVRWESLAPEKRIAMDFAEQLVAEFHQEDALREHLEDNNGELLAHVFFGQEVVQPLVELLGSNPDTETAKEYVGGLLRRYVSLVEDMWFHGNFDVRNVVTVTILERLGDNDRVWTSFAGYVTEAFAKEADIAGRENVFGRPFPGKDSPVQLNLARERQQLKDALMDESIPVSDVELTTRRDSYFAVADEDGVHTTVPVLRIGVSSHIRYMELGLGEITGSWGLDDARTKKVRELWKAQLANWNRYEEHPDFGNYYDDRMYILFYDQEVTDIARCVRRQKEELGRRISVMGLTEIEAIYSSSQPGYNVVYASGELYAKAENGGDFERVRQAALNLLAENLPGYQKSIDTLLGMQFLHPEMEGFNEYGLARED